MTKWAVMAIALVMAGTASARLRETPEQCAKRYGPPVHEGVEGRMTVQEFRKSGFSIRVYFLLEKEMLFAYTKAAAVVYTKPGDAGMPNQSLAETEIKTFLDANAEEEGWEQVDLIKQAAEAKPGPEQTQLIRNAGEYALWTRKSGAQAQYMKKTHHLVIRATQDVPLPKAEEAKPLEGF